MPSEILVIAVEMDRSFYRPGEPVRVQVDIESTLAEAHTVELAATLYHLLDPVHTARGQFELTPGRQTVALTFTPPPDAPRGYGLEVTVSDAQGRERESAWAALDVLEQWTQSPRYGFLSDFFPGRTDGEETMRTLNRFHINALQFYDWMYRHEQFLTDQEPYQDILDRTLSRQTVDSLIEAAHQRGIAAMPYTAVYGSSIDFYKAHPDWAIRDLHGKPVMFGENFMAIMDPRPGSPWTAHLLDQFREVLSQTQFDGIHLDQYGDPKAGYDDSGTRYDLAPVLADLIDATRALVDRERPGGAVVFNAVTAWPVEAVAPAGQDIVYIEVWPPYNLFNDLHSLITQAQVLGGGKPVVLAAYIDPRLESNVRLANAVIFASGAGHIELGERSGEAPVMLADPYFPKYQPLPASLAADLQRLYDFSVRYQDVSGPRTRDVTAQYRGRIEIQSQGQAVLTTTGMLKDKVFTIVRAGPGFDTLNLVNFKGVHSIEWKEPRAQEPERLEGLEVILHGAERQARRIWLASPDGEDLNPTVVEFTQDGSRLVFQAPALAYWTMVVVEWSD